MYNLWIKSYRRRESSVTENERGDKIGEYLYVRRSELRVRGEEGMPLTDDETEM